MAFKNEQLNNLTVYDEEYLRNLTVQFIEVMRSTEREGIDDLLTHLVEETDFFTAPASTRFHGNFKGGLLVHSVNVLNRFDSMCDAEGLDISKSSRLIVGGFHDFCKANQYKEVVKPLKNDALGKWYDCHTYEYTSENTIPLGHGEKSVMLLQKYIELTDLEMMCIRWHMGFSEEGAIKAGINDAFRYHKAVPAMHMADTMATTFDEITVDHKEIKAKEVNMQSNTTNKLTYK
ncbi:hydrolase [Paraclostridium bifermentans]|uniref:hydrolase n=1 Tax=Paraclostridium bifermentans TaxID=1490 RepID=UPI00374EC0E1